MAGEQTPAAIYRDRFAAARATLPGAGLGWLAELRERAIERFAGDGFPDGKVEEWKYTNLRALTKHAFQPGGALVDGVSADALARHGLTGIDSHVVVFVNGRFRAELSDVGALPAGASITSLAEALAERPELIEAHIGDPEKLVEERLSGQRDSRPHALTALNAAYMADGAVIHLARGAVIEAPIHILHITVASSRGEMTHPRNLIVAEAGSHATVLESYAGADDSSYWTNAVTQVVAERDAGIRHYKLQREGAAAFHVSTTFADLGGDNAYAGFVLSLGSGLSRNEARVTLDGPGAHCRLDGIYLARDSQSMDNWTRIDHRAAHCTSNEVYKGVVDDRARAAFQGKIRVWPEAPATEAHQANHNLLLSDDALANSKPELEILTDDVKCSHGSTVGDLDRDALFYLRARGVDAHAARRLLIEAFVNELVRGIEVAAVRGHFEHAVARWLARHGAGGREES